MNGWKLSTDKGADKRMAVKSEQAGLLRSFLREIDEPALRGLEGTNRRYLGPMR